VSCFDIFHAALYRRRAHSSTGKPVVFCLRPHKWNQLNEVCQDNAPLLAKALLSNDWVTGGLDKDNAYSTSLVLPALQVLDADPHEDNIQKGLERLKGKLGEEKGGVNLTGDTGTESAFITWWAIESLTSYSDIIEAKEEIDLSIEWAKGETYRQISYFNARSDLRNIHQLAFAWAICEKFGKESPLPPKISDLILDLIFNDQNEDGVWPHYYPLFNFTTAGAAYVYHFELLLALIWAIEDNPSKLADYLQNIEKILDWVETRKIKKTETHGEGWTITSHPEVRFIPVSWATIEVLHVLKCFGGYLNHIRRELIFDHLTGDSTETQKPLKKLDKLINVPLKVEKKNINTTIRTEFEDRIIKPITKNGNSREEIAKDSVALSIILFGPPGTSKTSLAKALAAELEWPLLQIDPSHCAPGDGVGVEMKVIEVFSCLEHVYRSVILLDEMDVLFRAREGEGADRVQRLWTTLMLPRLSRLRDKAQSIVIVTTNHIEDFDEAAKRPGRFDMVLPVGPPEPRGKLKELARRLEMKESEITDWCSEKTEAETAACFEHLLFGELDFLIRKMEGKKDKDSFFKALKAINDDIYLHLENKKHWESFQKTCKYTRLY